MQANNETGKNIKSQLELGRVETSILNLSSTQIPMHFNGDLRTILKLSIDGATRRLFAVMQHDRTVRAVLVPGLCCAVGF